MALALLSYSVLNIQLGIAVPCPMIIKISMERGLKNQSVSACGQSRSSEPWWLFRNLGSAIAMSDLFVLAPCEWPLSAGITVHAAATGMMNNNFAEI
jgi:hypothetical protein